MTLLLLELHHRLEEVHVEPRQTVDSLQLLQSLFAAVPFVADEPPHHQPVLLLDVGSVVLLVGPGTSEPDPLPSAAVVQLVVGELAAVVRVDPQEGKGQPLADVVYSAAHPFLTLPEHPAAFHPSGGHVHRAQSVQVEPLGRIPQVGHQVHPKNPGRLSSRSVKVLIGIAAFRRLPGLVVPKGRRSPRRRWGLRSRSMVAALISSTCLLTSASRTSSPCRSKAPANSPKKGCSLLPHIRSPASQTALKPLTASGPYFPGRGRFLPGEGSGRVLKARIRDLR